MSEGFAKPCLARGCRAEGLYGKGSLRDGTIRWACAAHRALLEPGKTAEPRAASPSAKSAAPVQELLL